MGHRLRHVRYDDFFSLADDGLGRSNIDGLREAVRDLLATMGPLEAHDLVIDLRHATEPPLAELLLIEGVSQFAKAGLGQANRVAVVHSPADDARARSLPLAEAAAAQMGLSVRVFDDIGEALDWLGS